MICTRGAILDVAVDARKGSPSFGHGADRGHAANAESVDMELCPTELLIFGNPAVGTKLMQAEQTVAIELPIKVLAWQDADGEVWIGYEDPAVFAERCGLAEHEAVQTVSGAFDKLTKAAIQP